MINRIEIAYGLYADEIACKCKRCVRVREEWNGIGNGIAHVDLLNAWTLIRAALTRPIKVVSGFRCPEHPLSVGRATPSQHSLGRALDMDWTGLDAFGTEGLIDLMAECGFTGIGIRIGAPYNIVHGDVREPKNPGEVLTWTYDPKTNLPTDYRKVRA